MGDISIMSESELEYEDKYSSYNSLNRNPLMFGIPILPFILIMVSMVITGFGGYAYFESPKAFIIPLILLMVLFVIRLYCMDNSRAMESMWWDLKGGIAKLRCKSSITSYSSNIENQKTKEAVINAWFKNNSIER